MIRILQIGMSDNLGGIEVFLINYYRKLNKNKIQFDFINMYDCDLCFQKEIESYGGKVYRLPNEKKHPFAYSKKLESIIKDNGYQIVHIHKNSLAFNISLKIVKKCNVKVKIIHSHNTKSSNPNFFINLLHEKNKKNISKYCDYFFACSAEAGKWMYNNSIINSSNYYVINNAIDLNSFKYNLEIRNTLRKELNISDEKFVIGHIGRFVKQKNHNFLIDIFNEVHKVNKNAILLLVGQGPLMEKIKEKVENLNLTNSVKFVGQRTDVNRFYQAFDYFLFPSLYEGLGIVVIEAQCSGLQCLCSTEVPLLVKTTNNVNFLNLNDDLLIWRDKILKSFKKNNRHNICAEITSNGFNIEKEILKLENIYKKSLEKNNN